MAWIYLAELVGLASHSSRGSEPSLTVSESDTLKPSYSVACPPESCITLLSGTTLRLSADPYSRPWISFTEDSPARTLALQELEQAWEEADRGYFSRSSDSLASFDPDSFSWRTSQLSLFGGLTEFSWSSLRWGTIVDGRLYQPQRWEPSIFENDGTYLPTPTACDYGKNVGRKSDGITPSGRDRWSLTVRAKRGELPGHPKGALNPEWIEQAMGYRIGWTVIEDWAIPFILKQREKRLKD